MTNMIKVWRFEDAPKELQELSPHGGDEDWLAVIPPGLADRFNRSTEIGYFGPCEVTEHHLPDGSVVRIGAHS